jgi:hypothetical protein
MLAEFGFLAIGVCFAAFAYTFKIYVLDKTGLKLIQFSYAYFCLALAMITWGVAVAIGGDRLLANSVFLGDFFIISGTVFMLDLLMGERNLLFTILGAAALLALFDIRTTHYAAHPHMANSVLLFDTPTPVAIGLGLIVLLIWLPANIRVAKMVTHKIKQDSITSLYSYIYIAATIFALLFITARRQLTVVISFIALGLCFALLLASNVLVEVIEDKHGRHATAKK